ncbi:hypothetical protein LOTGIDRAFT_162055 [Lottia gigantea]|uniref:PiggyBac transposable element-derived protein domain-containing protein n=1 Tax=Lottia gigantea TaxID=225164 RepID=V4A8H0_LOTGI|nr:hypothetical protein LOTGIDRAFT_162055 [Lottia gigantea]ESO93032.1 hypothetical protein LOTGIDRAFT_162055 [Lottia gigantea]
MSTNTSSRKRVFNVHEAISFIEEDGDDIRHVDIFLQPPGEGSLSDEDSGDEDNGAGINNLSKQQLLAQADVVVQFMSGEEVSLSAVDDDTPNDVHVPNLDEGQNIQATPSEVSRKRFTSSYTPVPPSQWRKIDIQQNLTTQRVWDQDPPEFLSASVSPTTMFEWFLDDQVVELLVNETNKRYTAARHIGRPPSTHASRCDKKVPLDVRTDGRNHYIASGGTQRRCAECGKKTMMMCGKCNVPIHLNYSFAFHRQGN